MKKTYLLALLLVSLLSGNAQSIVSNSGFEDFTGSSPNNWPTIESGITTAAENTIVDEGLKSIKIDFITTTFENTDLNQVITVEAGITYAISAKVYHLSTDNDARVGLVINGFKSYSDPSITDQWQTITTSFTATANASIQVGYKFYSLAGFNGSTVMYLDNLSMQDETTLSTKDFEALTFSMFPNPATNGFVNIKTISKTPTQVTVYNILGKQVINTTLNTDRLNVSSLKTGVYAVRLSQGNKTTTKKLVIK